MIRGTIGATVLALALSSSMAAYAASGPTDPQIAHIAYTAGQIDIEAAKQALAKSRNQEVRAFAETMVRDHTAVNDKALELVKSLNVTPAANPTSTALSEQAAQKHKELSQLDGNAFDKAYVQNEISFHRTVNGALGDTLIPNAQNARLKDLLGTGLKLFQEHQLHAEHLAKSLR